MWFQTVNDAATATIEQAEEGKDIYAAITVLTESLLKGFYSKFKFLYFTLFLNE